jgi:hypothetical protein
VAAVTAADELALADQAGAVPLGLAQEVEQALARVLRPVGAWRADGPGTGL